MIVQQVVNGREATITYFRSDWTPTDEQDAEWARVSYDDDGSAGVFAIEHPPTAIEKWDESKHPRRPGGEGGGQFVGTGSAGAAVLSAVETELGVATGTGVTEAKAFKAWFGDSKIVGPDGKPLVVYHGTKHDFDTFEARTMQRVYQGELSGKQLEVADSWDFGDDATGKPDAYHYGALSDAAILGPKAALEMRTKEFARYADSLSPSSKRQLADLKRLAGELGDEKPVPQSVLRPSGDAAWFTPHRSYNFIDRVDQLGEGANVKPVYLSIKNPVFLNASQIEAAGRADRVEHYRSQGYDGAIFAENPKDLTQWGINGAPQIVAFSPTQIKSVFNRGTFDPLNPSILKTAWNEGDHPRDEDGKFAFLQYHGTRGSQAFLDSTMFLTAERAVAEQYAAGSVLGASRRVVGEETPTIHTVGVDLKPSQIMDPNNPKAREDLMAAVAEHNAQFAGDNPDEFISPKGVAPTHGLNSAVSFGDIANPTFRERLAAKGYHAAVVHEGSQGLSLAVFNPKKHVTILSSNPIKKASAPVFEWVEKRWDPAKHPRVPKGSAAGGEFGSEVSAVVGLIGGKKPKGDAPGLKLKAVAKAALGDDMEPVVLKNALSKLESGELGERIAIAYLQANGISDARGLNVGRNNFPVDLIGDHQVIEVKAGMASNGRAAQKWRTTIGQPGPAEAAWLAKAGPDEKAAWNQKKSAAIISRKQKVVSAFSKRLGKKIKPKTVTMIIDSDRKVADLYVFEGFHSVINWRSPEAKAGYIGTYKYG
jgi:hypothetical protein